MTAQRSNPRRLAALLAASATIAVLAVACGGREDADQAETDAPPSPSAQPADSSDSSDTSDSSGDPYGLTAEQRDQVTALVEQQRRANPERVVTRIDLKDGENAITLPEDFPLDVPLYPASNPTRYISSQQSGTLITLVIDESPDTAHRYYSGALANEGWTIELDGSSSDLMMLSATKDARTLAVAITESNGETTITLIESTE